MSTAITAAPARRGHVLTIWTPEDKAFWSQQGEAIAKINLWISVPALSRTMPTMRPVPLSMLS